MDVEIELGAGIGENVKVVMPCVLEMEAAYDERMSTQWTDMAFGLYR